MGTQLPADATLRNSLNSPVVSHCFLFIVRRERAGNISPPVFFAEAVAAATHLAGLNLSPLHAEKAADRASQLNRGDADRR